MHVAAFARINRLFLILTDNVDFLLAVNARCLPCCCKRSLDGVATCTPTTGLSFAFWVGVDKLLLQSLANSLLDAVSLMEPLAVLGVGNRLSHQLGDGLQGELFPADIQIRLFSYIAQRTYKHRLTRHMQNSPIVQTIVHGVCQGVSVGLGDLFCLHKLHMVQL